MRGAPFLSGDIDSTLVRRRLTLLYVCDEGGSLLWVNEPWNPKGPAPAAHVCLGRGMLVRSCRHDLPGLTAQGLATALDALAPPVDLQDRLFQALVLDLLRTYTGLSTQESGPVYRFPDMTGESPGVETLPAFRRRGYGAEVVAGWASRVQKSGLTPMYSTSWNNLPSIGIANELGLVQLAVDLSVS